MLAILAGLSPVLALSRGLVAVGPDYTIPIVLGIAVIVVAGLASAMTLKKK
jgi:threonine/homoserine efflux transporter RhtA